jgi:hypothetical protein
MIEFSLLQTPDEQRPTTPLDCATKFKPSSSWPSRRQTNGVIWGKIYNGFEKAVAQQTNARPAHADRAP